MSAGTLTVEWFDAAAFEAVFAGVVAQYIGTSAALRELDEAMSRYRRHAMHAAYRAKTGRRK